MYIVKNFFLQTENRIIEGQKIKINKKFWDGTNNLFNLSTNENEKFDPPNLNEKIIVYENNKFINNEVKFYYESLLDYTREKIIKIFIIYNEMEI
jgi:hypothetical protein